MREAANDFLELPEHYHRVTLENYYQYRGPSEKQKKEQKAPHLFDSALVEGNEVKESQTPREAYCVIVEGKHRGCPSAIATLSAGIGGGVDVPTATMGASVEPAGQPTTYSFEYGLTSVDERTTTATAAPNEVGEQTVTATVGELKPCSTYHYQAIAESEAAEGSPTFGGEKTFETRCQNCPERKLLGTGTLRLRGERTEGNETAESGGGEGWEVAEQCR